MFAQADIADTLHSIPWFLELKPHQIQRLASIATIQQFKAGEVLFNEGDRVEALYILLDGQVVLDLFVPTRGPLPFFTAEPLDVIGWSSLTPVVRQRTASARATLNSLVLRLEAKSLAQMCEEDHDLGYVIHRRLSNVVASRMLTTRLQLLAIISGEPDLLEP